MLPFSNLMSKSVTTQDIPISATSAKVALEQTDSSVKNKEVSFEENVKPKLIDCDSLIKEIDSENSKLDAIINENVNSTSTPQKGSLLEQNQNNNLGTTYAEAAVTSTSDEMVARSKKRKEFIAVIFLCASTACIITVLIVYFVVLKSKASTPFTK